MKLGLVGVLPAVHPSNNQLKALQAFRHRPQCRPPHGCNALFEYQGDLELALEAYRRPYCPAPPSKISTEVQTAVLSLVISSLRQTSLRPFYCRIIWIKFTGTRRAGQDLRAERLGGLRVGPNSLVRPLSLHIVIVDCGLGGLAAAHTLAKSDHRITILEYALLARLELEFKSVGTLAGSGVWERCWRRLPLFRGSTNSEDVSRRSLPVSRRL